MVSTKPGPTLGSPAWLGKGLCCVSLARYRDEPRDDTGDRDENRALGH
jgi:hypothetical protein